MISLAGMLSGRSLPVISRSISAIRSLLTPSKDTTRASGIAASLSRVQATLNRRAGKPKLGRDRLESLHDRPDVVVEVDAELLRALVDVLAVDPRRERGLLQLLAHRLGLEALETRGADERARVHEARELVAREERLLQRRVARQAEVLGMGEHGLDDLVRVALLAQDRRPVLRVLLERRMHLVVEVVEECGDAPQLLVTAEL